MDRTYARDGELAHATDERKVGQAAPMRGGRALEQARHALGNPELRAQFDVDPVSFLERFGVHGMAADAAAARALLGVAGSAQHADPTGQSAAHDHLVVARSPIHGQGVFARAPISAGTVVSRLVVGEDVSYTASKVNHASNANVVPQQTGAGVVLATTREIPAGSEVVGNYPFPGK